MVTCFFASGSGAGDGIRYLTEPREPVAEILRGDIDQMVELIDSLDFSQRYCSGVHRFTESNIPDETLNKIMDSFEELMFTGLTHEQTPPVLWVKHQEKGGTELHFIIPECEMEKGRKFTVYLHKLDVNLVDSWKNNINNEFGFTDPCEPERRQSLTISKNLPRDTNDLKVAIHNEIENLVKNGVINSRSDVINSLTDAGFEISSLKKNSISIKCEDKSRPIRLSGDFYSEQFTSTEELRRTIEESSRDYKQSASKRFDDVSKQLQIESDRRRERISNRFGNDSEEVKDISQRDTARIRENIEQYQIQYYKHRERLSKELGRASKQIEDTSESGTRGIRESIEQHQGQHDDDDAEHAERERIRIQKERASKSNKNTDNSHTNRDSCNNVDRVIDSLGTISNEREREHTKGVDEHKERINEPQYGTEDYGRKENQNFYRERSVDVREHNSKGQSETESMFKNKFSRNTGENIRFDRKRESLVKRRGGLHGREENTKVTHISKIRNINKIRNISDIRCISDIESLNESKASKIKKQASKLINRIRYFNERARNTFNEVVGNIVNAIQGGNEGVKQVSEQFGKADREIRQSAERIDERIRDIKQSAEDYNASTRKPTKDFNESIRKSAEGFDNSIRKSSEGHEGSRRASEEGFDKSIRKSDSGFDESIRNNSKNVERRLTKMIENRTDELDIFKKNISLAHYASKFGYELDKSESSRNSYVMRGPNDDKIVVSTNTNGHGVFFSVRNESDNGTIIDFHQKRTGDNLGQTRKALRKELNESSVINEIKSKPRPTDNDITKIIQAISKMKTAEDNSYLQMARKIPKEILTDDRFKQDVKQDRIGVAIFLHRDDSGFSGYEMKHSSYTAFSTGGKKSLWRSSNLSYANQIVVTESGIDALSHAALHKDSDTAYISFGGSMSSDQKQLLKDVLNKEERRGAEIVLALDNDDAGRKMTAEISEMLLSVPKIDIPKEGYKDWNDVLKGIGKEKQIEEKKPISDSDLVKISFNKFLGDRVNELNNLKKEIEINKRKNEIERKEIKEEKNEYKDKIETKEQKKPSKGRGR